MFSNLLLHSRKEAKKYTFHLLKIRRSNTNGKKYLVDMLFSSNHASSNYYRNQSDYHQLMLLDRNQILKLLVDVIKRSLTIEYYIIHVEIQRQGTKTQTVRHAHPPPSHTHHLPYVVTYLQQFVHHLNVFDLNIILKTNY